MTFLLYLAFTLSGAAGLMYEAIWSRYLGLFVGHSAYAQIIVLVIFLGGMSLGALAVGRWAERVRSPLLWYAAAELLVGLIAIVFHDAFVASTGWAYDRILPSLPGPLAVQAVKWTLAALLVLPQSVLLGTTFPLMSAGVIRRGGETGRTLSLLYFTNSIGAAGGVLLAGFWLLAAAGLPGTLLFAAIVNIVVALLVGLVGRHESDAAREARAARALERLDRYPESAEASDPARDEAVAPDAPVSANVPVGGAPRRPESAPGLERLLLAVAFGTAVASFIYEIAWIRMLSLVLGSATHSFEIMLSAFILGIALGAFWVRRHADRFRRPLLALGVVQWAMGALAVLTLPVYLLTFHITAGLLQALDVTSAGYSAFTVARYGIALLVMLPATFCAGMTLPLITRTLMSAGGGERAIGTVYGVNTFGSIVGASLAGLVLLPLLGLKALLVVGALVDMGLGVWLVIRSGVVPALPDEHLSVRHAARPDATSAGTRRLALGVGGATLVVLVLVVSLTRFAPDLLASGVYRYGRANLRPGVDSVLSYRDGRTASVAVRQSRNSGDITIATNGKPDASVGLDWLRPVAAGGHRTLSGDQPTQMLLPLVTLAHAPRASEMAVIGQGSGMSSHFLLGSPHLKRLVTIDIEPEMIRGSRFFYPANRRVFDDPRSSFAIDDAKSYFATQLRKYDLILSEPSNPWVSGVSGLFTTEFYAEVRDYLSPNGVFGQWLHLYEIDDGLVLSVIAAVHQNFPAYEIYLVANSDMLIVAGNSPQLPPADWSVFDYAGVQEDVKHLAPPIARTDLEALRIGSRRSLAPLLDARFGGATANSDFYPTLDLGAERARYLGASASGLAGLGSSRFDILAALTDRRRDFGTALESSIPGIPRLDALATGARLRLTTTAADSFTTDEARDARFTVDAFRRTLASSAPPTDWRRWTHTFAAAEDHLHNGTAGVMDEQFYAEVAAYLDRANAPAGPRVCVRFMRGLASWNWTDVREATPALLSAASRGEEWLPYEIVRNGAVVAHLRAGDAANAREVFNRLAPRMPSGAGVRSTLLEAWLGRWERAARK